MLEEARSSIVGNSSVEHLHPNRKARAPVVLTKFGFEVDSTEECSWTVTDAHKCVTGTLPERRLWCKTWSELGLTRATDWVVRIKLRPIAFLIVLTDRFAIKAREKGADRSYTCSSGLSTRVNECGVSEAGDPSTGIWG